MNLWYKVYTVSTQWRLEGLHLLDLKGFEPRFTVITTSIKYGQLTFDFFTNRENGLVGTTVLQKRGNREL